MCSLLAAKLGVRAILGYFAPCNILHIVVQMSTYLLYHVVSDQIANTQVGQTAIKLPLAIFTILWYNYVDFTDFNQFLPFTRISADENEEGIVQTPKSGDWYADDQLSFAADTRWDEFIVAHYAATSTPIPTYTLPGPRGGIRPTQQKVYLPLVLKTQ